MSKTLYLLFVLLFSTTLMSQQSGQTERLYMYQLPPLYVTPSSKSKRMYKKHSRLERRVRKVYPYALLAKEMMIRIDSVCQKLETKKERKNYIKGEEKRLIAQYKVVAKRMTVSEGIILLKLIDREIGNTSYELLDELRGSLQAFFWQQVARFFGHNLKDPYDPEGEDADIEAIIQTIIMENKRP